METSRLITADCPIANGRTPEPGDHMYMVIFPLEDGTRLEVLMGQPGMEALKAFVRDMRLDDFVASVLEDD